MVKVCKSRRKRERSGVAESSSEEPPVVSDGEEDFTGAVSGEEDGSEDERKRQKLLEAIGALGGKRRKHTLGERSEAAAFMSEFTMNADGEAELADLVRTMDKTSGATVKTRKQLNKLQLNKQTLKCPLSRQDQDRIQRGVAFQKAASEVSRWSSIITQNQKAQQLVFPLNQDPPGPKPIEAVVMGWKASTPLETEIFTLLSANKQPVHDAVLTPAEEASVKAMNLEEVKIRRAELQKARALQSYYEAKAHREKKIKSKKYHKVQNKAKRKDFQKQFDHLVKTDPAAALEELEKMERARMQERMSLKHQNSGKWAKSKAIMAKYDEGARKAMQQQLEVNKDLTQKPVTSLNNQEEEEEEEDNADMLPDFVNDAEDKLHSANPWMRGKLSEEPVEVKDAVGVTEGGASAVATEVEEEEGEAEETEEEALLRGFDSRRRERQNQESDPAEIICLDSEEEQETEDNPVTQASDGSDDEEEEEEERLSEFTGMIQGAGKSLKEKEAANDEASRETSEELQEERIRSVEDVDLLPQDPPAEPQQAPTPEHPPSAKQQPLRSRKKKKGIQLKDVLTKQTKVIKVPLAPTITESEEKLDQRGLISEAFAGDDVIADFVRDKRKQEEGGKPKEVDLTLPGWGEWGGQGLKPSGRKRRRFRMKTVVPPPRKDQHLPSVIISEKRNTSVSPHQVNYLPFPFENHAQFESCIRNPLGRTWNTERTVKKMTTPRVVTQLGAIIQPMTNEELLKDKKKVSGSQQTKYYQTFPE